MSEGFVAKEGGGSGKIARGTVRVPATTYGPIEIDIGFDPETFSITRFGHQYGTVGIPTNALYTMIHDDNDKTCLIFGINNYGEARVGEITYGFEDYFSCANGVMTLRGNGVPFVAGYDYYWVATQG